MGWQQIFIVDTPPFYCELLVLLQVLFYPRNTSKCLPKRRRVERRVRRNQQRLKHPLLSMEFRQKKCPKSNWRSISCAFVKNLIGKGRKGITSNLKETKLIPFGRLQRGS